MNPRIPFLAVAASLPLVAFAADCDGDLRDLVAIHPPGAVPGRLTFAGIGAGSPSAEASAKFEDDRGFPRRFIADFGTELVVLFSGVRGGRTGQLSLMYTGNPIAVRGVLDRWKEVLVRAGAGCTEESCFLEEEGAMVAVLSSRREGLTWEVYVTIQR